MLGNDITDKIQDYANQVNAGQIGRAECGTTEMAGKYAPPTFRESLGKRMEHAKAEGSKSKDLQELCALLDKNPEIARILNLIEKVGKY